MIAEENEILGTGETAEGNGVTQAQDGAAAGAEYRGPMPEANTAGAAADAAEPSANKQADAHYTQRELDAMFKDRAERAKRSIWEGYGFRNKTELDKAVEQSKLYAQAKGKAEAYDQMRERLALVSNDIAEDKADDVRYWFKGKGVELNEDTLKEALESHPEWKKSKSDAKAPEVLGAPKPGSQPEPDEYQTKVRHLFGLDRGKGF